MWSALESFDEYGNKLAVSQDKSTGALNYSWLGGKERATDLSGLVLMGVRLYNSVTGQFTSVDPVKGGNTTAYAYPQDPINQFDLDGNARTWKKTAGVFRKIGRVTAVAGFAACVPASAGLCGAATAVGLGVSAGLNYSRYRAKEISGAQAARGFAVDFALSRVPGARSTHYSGAHSASGRSITLRKFINSRGTIARHGSRQGSRGSNSVRGAVSASVRTYKKNMQLGWKFHPTRYSARTIMHAGIYANSWR